MFGMTFLCWRASGNDHGGGKWAGHPGAAFAPLSLPGGTRGARTTFLKKRREMVRWRERGMFHETFFFYTVSKCFTKGVAGTLGWG
jgi:hypothetical protein